MQASSSSSPTKPLIENQFDSSASMKTRKLSDTIEINNEKRIKLDNTNLFFVDNPKIIPARINTKFVQSISSHRFVDMIGKSSNTIKPIVSTNVDCINYYEESSFSVNMMFTDLSSRWIVKKCTIKLSNPNFIALKNNKEQYDFAITMPNIMQYQLNCPEDDIFKYSINNTLNIPFDEIQLLQNIFLGINFFQDTVIHIYHYKLDLYNTSSLNDNQKEELGKQFLSMSDQIRKSDISCDENKKIFFMHQINNTKMKIYINDDDITTLQKDVYPNFCSLDEAQPHYAQNNRPRMFISEDELYKNTSLLNSPTRMNLKNCLIKEVQFNYNFNDNNIKNNLVVELLVFKNKTHIPLSISPIHWSKVCEFVIEQNKEKIYGFISWHYTDISYFLHNIYPYSTFAKLDTTSNEFTSFINYSNSPKIDCTDLPKAIISLNLPEIIYYPVQNSFERLVKPISGKTYLQTYRNNAAFKYSTITYDYTIQSTFAYMHSTANDKALYPNDINLKITKLEATYGTDDIRLGIKRFSNLLIHIHGLYIDTYLNSNVTTLLNSPKLSSKIEIDIDITNQYKGFFFTALINNKKTHVYINHILSYTYNNSIMILNESEDYFELKEPPKQPIVLTEEDLQSPRIIKIKSLEPIEYQTEVSFALPSDPKQKKSVKMTVIKSDIVFSDREYLRSCDGMHLNRSLDTKSLRILSPSTESNIAKATISNDFLHENNLEAIIRVPDLDGLTSRCIYDRIKDDNLGAVYWNPL